MLKNKKIGKYLIPRFLLGITLSVLSILILRSWFVGATSSAAASGVGPTLVPGRWVEMQANGVVTGSSGGLGPLVLCRAEFDGGHHRGKVWQGQCHFEWGWEDKVSSKYQVLLDDSYKWVNPFVLPPAGTLSQNTAQVPHNAVDGGDAGNAANHSRLAICQAFIPQDRTWHPGKFYANRCNIAWGGPGGNVSKARKVRKPDQEGNVLILVKP